MSVIGGSDLIILALLMGVAAALYASVGHGGASAYLALMALFGVFPAIMRPTALALNVVAAEIGTSAMFGPVISMLRFAVRDLRRSRACRCLFVADIDHACTPLGIDMAEAAHAQTFRRRGICPAIEQGR